MHFLFVGVHCKLLGSYQDGRNIKNDICVLVAPVVFNLGDDISDLVVLRKCSGIFFNFSSYYFRYIFFI